MVLNFNFFFLLKIFFFFGLGGNDRSDVKMGGMVAGIMMRRARGRRPWRSSIE